MVRPVCASVRAIPRAVASARAHFAARSATRVAALSIAAVAALSIPAAAQAATFRVATNGSDSAACTTAAPCATFQRAYQVASAGDTVEIAGGTYKGQGFDTSAEARRPADRFQPVSGQSVTVGSVDITRGSYMEFRDLTVARTTYNRQGAQYITYRRVNMMSFFIRGADHI